MYPQEYEETKIPCELCGEPTAFTGTKRCNGCWELERRIHDQPDLARKILDAMKDGQC